MYLYEKNKNEIYIYKLVPNDEKLKKFREDEMKKQENIFWLATVRDQLFQRGPVKTYRGKHLFENISSGSCINVTELNNEANWHQFKENKFNPGLFNAYCMGQYDINPVVKIVKQTYGYSKEDQKLYDDYQTQHDDFKKSHNFAEDVTTVRKIWGENFHKHMSKSPDFPNIEKKVISTDVMQYLVLIETTYYKNENDNNVYNGSLVRYHMNLISIPKSLYLLHMLEQFNHSEISEENIEQQLELFNFNANPIQTVPIEYLEKLIQCNLIKYSYDNMDTLFNTHQEMLKILKRKH